MEGSVPVMGWPFDFVILSRRRRILVRDENDSSVIHAGSGAPSRPPVVTNMYSTYYFYRDPSLCSGRRWEAGRYGGQRAGHGLAL